MRQTRLWYTTTSKEKCQEKKKKNLTTTLLLLLRQLSWMQPEKLGEQMLLFLKLNRWKPVAYFPRIVRSLKTTHSSDQPREPMANILWL